MVGECWNHGVPALELRELAFPEMIPPLPGVGEVCILHTASGEVDWVLGYVKNIDSGGENRA